MRYFFEDPGEGVSVVFIPGIDQKIKVRQGLVVCPACRSVGRELITQGGVIRCPGCEFEFKVARVMRRARKARKESERQALYLESVRLRKEARKALSKACDKAALARLAAILNGGG